MKKNRKKYYITVGIGCLTIMVIAVIGIVNYVNFYKDATWSDIFSNNQLPLYATEELYVNSEENYYIGGYHNKYVQVFNSVGEYKMTISIPSNSGSFFIDKEGFNYIDYSYGEYILDIEERKILSQRELSDEESDNFFAQYSQFTEGVYNQDGKVYTLERNKIEIKDYNNTKLVELKDIPLLPLPFTAWCIIFAIGYFGLIIYLKLVFCR